MATSPRKLATNSKYLQKLDQIVIRLHRDGKKEITKLDIDMAATEAGISTNAYIIAAIKARMEGGTGPQVEDTPETPQTAQDGAETSGSINIPMEAVKTAQEAAERQGKPMPDWIANAIDAQNEREKRMGALSQAAAQAKENRKKESSSQ